MNDVKEKNKIEGGTLYLVATPIGNLSDLSYRGEKILAGVDFIAAEDTRVSAKLLSAIGVSKPMVIYHEHNKRECGAKIASRLLDGESCALVTDAGTPCISDPGADITRLCIENGINVTSVPGACAAICALTLSGFDTRRFVFEGFPEGNTNAKREFFANLAKEKRTVIMYESPHEIKKTVSLMYEAMPHRRIALCRELTKLNEEVWRGTVEEAVELFENRESRGEYVIVIEGAGEEKGFWEDMSIEEHVEFYLNSGMERMASVKAVARDRGLSKNAVYSYMLEKKAEN
jgi:16S rRNA (cytidine1402-2'-O)-methyltransferase